MYVKIHESGSKVLAVCDKELIGKKFEENDLCLDVSERFYKGEEVSDEKALNLIKEYDNVNIVGKKSVNLALKNNLINKENIIKIKGVPHAQIIT